MVARLILLPEDGDYTLLRTSMKADLCTAASMTTGESESASIGVEGSMAVNVHDGRQRQFPERTPSPPESSDGDSGRREFGGGQAMAWWGKGRKKKLGCHFEVGAFCTRRVARARAKSAVMMSSSTMNTPCKLQLGLPAPPDLYVWYSLPTHVILYIFSFLATYYEHGRADVKNRRTSYTDVITCFFRAKPVIMKDYKNGPHPLNGENLNLQSIDTMMKTTTTGVSLVEANREA
ncbi:hypothetical protein IW261DRAFT_1632138 [Armillaria novae-zelandiae]|uniref:Uncharacterized protein n=1 Tax=Armillaria novae-zelandiae TaxID=153914 RepID=A0AA39P6M8_9AGAR|nr:hypothetical protein IW261DRAFT_1632138 [Armillaria novae-zelandiae]